MKKTNAVEKRKAGPLKIDLDFDEAIRRALKVKPSTREPKRLAKQRGK